MTVGVLHITVGVFMLMGAFIPLWALINFSGCFYIDVGVYKFLWAFLYRCGHF
jgi:hypothetical protein